MTDKQGNVAKIVVAVIVVILLFVGGFFLGRSTIKTKTITKTEYVELPPIHDTIKIYKPKYVELPADTASIIQSCVEDGIYSELFPEKIITEYVNFTSEDTMAILIDWASKKVYSQVLFDIDTVGRCEVTGMVQYNRLDSIGYIFTPIQKTITNDNYLVKNVSPFVGGGFDVNHIGSTPTFDIQAEAGVFFKEKYGVAIDYRYDFIDRGHSVGGLFLYKF